jgi:hypothetical protein
VPAFDIHLLWLIQIALETLYSMTQAYQTQLDMAQLLLAVCLFGLYSYYMHTNRYHYEVLMMQVREAHNS